MGCAPHEAPSSSPRGSEDARDSKAPLPDSPREHHSAADAGELRNSDRRNRPSRILRNTKGRLPLHREAPPSRLLRPERGPWRSPLPCSAPRENPKSSGQTEGFPPRRVPQILPIEMIRLVARYRSRTSEGLRVFRGRGPSCFPEKQPKKDRNEDQSLARFAPTIYRASHVSGACDNALRPHTRRPSPRR